MSGNSCDTVKKGIARKLGTTRRSMSGFVPMKSGSFVAYESRLERDFLVKMNSNLAVLDIIPQPISIPFSYPSGRSYKYTPDFLVYFKLGNHHPNFYPKPLLVEIKYKSDWQNNWRKWLPKWKAAWRYAQENGYSFHILDESRIRDKTLENIEFLSRYKRMTFDADLSQVIIANLKQRGQMTFSSLLCCHFSILEQASGISHLWHLISTNKIRCDLSLPLTNDSYLWTSDYD
ncbi:MAG: heteromeric transposase endonuclease subunit TnsA [Vibrio hibernica]